MPALDLTAPSLVPTRPWVPGTWHADRVARLRRLSIVPAVPVRVVRPEPVVEPEPEIVVEVPVPSPPSVITIAAVIAAVATYFEVRADTFVAKTRKHPHVHRRQLAMYLAREITRRSYPEIARRFGGYDHTTCLHACWQIEAKIARQEPDTLAAIAAVRAALGAE